MEVENRVLLVEDEAPLRRSLEKFLERAGCAYVSCATAREALALAEKFDFPIVLAEYHLPDANGIDLLRKLKRIAPDLAAIVISEFDLHAAVDEMTQANVRSFLRKPFDLVDLENALFSARSEERVSFKNVVRSRELRLKDVPAPPFFRLLSEF